MKKKKIKKLVYKGLGFPVILKNVPFIKIHGEMVPDIDFNDLQKVVLLNLCYKSAPLTGNEIKFIRKYFEMTLTEFGKNFGCSHVAVLKWEKHDNNFAKIEPTTDVYIRLFILSRLNCKSKAFKQLYDELDIVQFAKCFNHVMHNVLSIDIEEKTKMVG